jgi:hypothetical protein
MLHDVRGGVLGGQQCHPHVPCGVIDQQQEVTPTAGSHRRDGATKITVDELQRVLRVVLGFSREWGETVLGDDARVAELANVVDRR